MKKLSCPTFWMYSTSYWNKRDTNERVVGMNGCYIKWHILVSTLWFKVRFIKFKEAKHKFNCFSLLIVLRDELDILKEKILSITESKGEWVLFKVYSKSSHLHIMCT